MKKGYFVKEISELLEIEFKGNPELFITNVSTLENAQNSELAFLFEKKYYSKKELTSASCLLVHKSFETDNKFTYLISDNPKFSMVKILELFDKKTYLSGIHSSIKDSENFKYGENISIYPNVFIGNNVILGNNVKILPNSYIGDNVKISDNTLIHPNVTIYDNSKIGQNVIIHSGTIIGSDGYGYIQLEENLHYKVPQIGNVIINDNVEIGSNVTIDRGTIGSTIIGEGSKIDNMVHIAHNVEIGKRTLIVAQVGIAGSTKIGNNVVIAGQSGISGHIEIGDESLILSRSGVAKNIPPKSKVSGFPARDHKSDFKILAFINRIPKLFEELKLLQNKVKNIEEKLPKS